ncbi:transcription factor subunit Med10 of mediator complex-domain-containing protein, partial [Vararia minispora EC-137]
APDSPRSSQSPPPDGVQGDLELELMGLVTALYNLGRTVAYAPKEKDRLQVTNNVPPLVDEVLQHLASIDTIAPLLKTTIPLQVIGDVDQSRNPANLVRDAIERAATENQFMNGKIRAIESYKTMLDAALMKAFPDLAEAL